MLMSLMMFSMIFVMVKIVLERICAVIRQEMDAAGAQEVSFSVVTSADAWKKSGRYAKYGKEYLKFKIREVSG